MYLEVIGIPPRVGFFEGRKGGIVHRARFAIELSSQVTVIKNRINSTVERELSVLLWLG